MIPRQRPHRGPAQLEAAWRYSKLYPQDIDPQIEANERAFDEGVRMGLIVQA